jgi:hypothetical protein
LPLPARRFGLAVLRKAQQILPALPPPVQQRVQQLQTEAPANTGLANARHCEETILTENKRGSATYQHSQDEHHPELAKNSA